MAKLTLKKKGGIVAEYDLTKLPAKLTIGSDPFDIIFIYDEKIFKKQLQLERIDEHYFVENLYSTQGALLNGQILDKKVEIHDRDEISLGEHILIFSGIEKVKIIPTEDRFSFLNMKPEKVSEPEPVVKRDESSNRFAAQSTGNGDETIVYFNKDLASFESPAEMATIKIPAAPPAYDLLVIHGPYSGNSYRLKPDLTRIGRDLNSNDIVIRETKKGEIDYTISRRHATITFKDGCYYLSDNNSKNGTYLNQERLGKNDERLLKDRDEIEIVSQEASTIFRFVPAGHHDFAPPQKIAVTGKRRSQSIIAVGLSMVFMIAGLILLLTSYSQRSIILARPESLTISHKQLSASKAFGNIQAKIPKVSNLNRHIPTPALVNINKDNESVVLILAAPDEQLTAWDLNKEQLVWKERQSQSDYSVTTVDINSDGSSEILVSGRDSRVYAIDGRHGNLIWKSDFLRGKLSSQPSVGDLNGDGFQDIVVCSEEGLIHCGIASAQDMVWKSLQFDYKTKAIPIVVDIEADGSDEILLGTESGIVLVFVLKGQEIQLKKVFDIKMASSAFINNSINNAMASGRLSAARRESVLIIATRQYGVIAIDPTNFKHLWSDKLTDPYRQLPLYYCSPLLSDINADGRLDAVVASHNGEIILYSNVANSDANESQPRLWTFRSKQGAAFVATPALADLNKDNIIDIVACDTMGTLYGIDGKNGIDLFEPIKSNASFSASPLAGDVNGDGYLDIIVIDNSCNIHWYQTVTKIIRNTIIWDQHAGTANHSCLFLSDRENIFFYNLKFYSGILLIVAVLGYWIVVFLRWRWLELRRA